MFNKECFMEVFGSRFFMEGLGIWFYVLISERQSTNKDEEEFGNKKMDHQNSKEPTTSQVFWVHIESGWVLASISMNTPLREGEGGPRKERGSSNYVC